MQLMSAGTIVDWQGEHGPLKIAIQTNPTCIEVILRDGSHSDCNDVMWKVSGAASQQSLTLRIKRADGSTESPTLYAMNIGQLKATTLSPGTIAADGSVREAGGVFTLPGALGSLSVQHLSLSRTQMSGALAPVTSGQPFTIQDTFRVSSAPRSDQTIYAHTQVSFQTPFDVQGASSTLDLGKMALRTTGIQLGHFATPTTANLGPVQLTLTDAALASLAAGELLTLTGTLKSADYFPATTFAMTLPVNISASGVRVTCDNPSNLFSFAQSARGLLTIRNVTPACENQLMTGMSIAADAALPNTDPVHLPVITVGGGSVTSGPADLKALLRNAHLFGFDFEPTVATLDFNSSAQSAQPTPGVFLTLAGAVQLPGWLDSARVTLATTIINLNSPTALDNTTLALDTTSNINLLGATFATSDSCTTPTGIKLAAHQPPEFDLCGNLTLPSFLADQGPRYVVTSADKAPSLQVSGHQSTDYAFTLNAAFIPCPLHQSTPAKPCGLKYAKVRDSIATSTAASAGDCGNRRYIDLAVARITLDDLQLTDDSGNNLANLSALGRDPTGFTAKGAVETEGVLQSTNKVCFTAAFNRVGFFASTTSGSVTVHMGTSEAQFSNIQMAVGDLRRSVHGAVIVTPNEGNLPKVYVRDIGVDLTRKTTSDSWRIATGFTPDYWKTALSVAQFIVSLYVGKLIIK